jgi:hypothetical protein
MFSIRSTPTPTPPHKGEGLPSGAVLRSLEHPSIGQTPIGQTKSVGIGKVRKETQ